MTDKARIAGSTLVIVAYYFILNVDQTVGVSLNLIGDIISLPYFIRHKAFDVVVMLGVLITISLHSVIP